MERKTIEQNKEQKRDYAVLVGLRSPVLGADSADEESLAELGGAGGDCRRRAGGYYPPEPGEA